MKKEEYISLLKQQLKGLEDTEIQDAVGYVEEYFDEAQDDARTYQSPHKLIKNITIILGGIFGLPIALPLLLCIIVVLFCMVLVIFLMMLSLIIATIALLYGAAASLCVGFIYAHKILSKQTKPPRSWIICLFNQSYGIEKRHTILYSHMRSDLSSL